ncbi:MAG: GIY-YIG nuclease family protein [Acidobacteriota bacterium]
MSTWHIYLIRTRSGSLYAGTATDVQRRLAEHRQGGRRGSRYLRSRGPLELVYEAEIGGRSLAHRVEHRIKKLPKRKKEAIVSTSPKPPALLALLDLTP